MPQNFFKAFGSFWDFLGVWDIIEDYLKVFQEVFNSFLVALEILGKFFWNIFDNFGKFFNTQYSKDFFNFFAEFQGVAKNDIKNSAGFGRHLKTLQMVPQWEKG